MNILSIIEAELLWNRVGLLTVTRYKGSGITEPGSEITSRGIGISSTVRGSGIRFLSRI